MVAAKCGRDALSGSAASGKVFDVDSDTAQRHKVRAPMTTDVLCCGEPKPGNPFYMLTLAVYRSASQKFGDWQTLSDRVGRRITTTSRSTLLCRNLRARERQSLCCGRQRLSALQLSVVA